MELLTAILGVPSGSIQKILSLPFTLQLLVLLEFLLQSYIIWMFAFGSLIAFLDLLASFTALALTIVISVAMAGMKSQLRDGSSTFIVTTCCLQTAGYVTKRRVDVAKAFKEQILTFYHNFHVIPKRHFQPSSQSGLQLTNSSYPSCALAFPLILVQSPLQH